MARLDRPPPAPSSAGIALALAELPLHLLRFDPLAGRCRFATGFRYNQPGLTAVKFAL